MALPKKTSRSIQVQGQAYRWMVRATENDLILTVQHASEGQLLQVPLHKLNLFRRTSDATWTLAKQGQQITPWLVRQLIETAREQGWQSETKNLPVFLFREIAWEHEYFFEPHRMRLDQWLDPLVQEEASREGLSPTAHLALCEAERIADALAWPNETTDALFNQPGVPLAIPETWLSSAAREARLSFQAVVAQNDEQACWLRVWCNEFHSASAKTTFL